MARITIISELEELGRDVSSRLSLFFDTDRFALSALPDEPPGQFTLVDVNLRDPLQFSGLRHWLQRKPADGQVVFGIDRGSHIQAVQAYAIGATALLPRPIDGKRLSQTLASTVGDRMGDPDEFPDLRTHGVSAGVSALQLIFAAAAWGDALDPQYVQTAGETVVQCIETEGLSQWLDVVRRHHSQTYQHCLIVTGVAVSFGLHLGFHAADKRRLAFAGLLHDIGKARIPIEILEKPEPLNEAETVVMQSHPVLGYEILKDLPEFQPEMLDMVVHHHELLDGSGYPDGLSGNEISDLVRTITISDIYGALIERRPYRAPFSGAEAHQMLVGMGPKLDVDLVREFRAISRMR